MELEGQENEEGEEEEGEEEEGEEDELGSQENSADFSEYSDEEDATVATVFHDAISVFTCLCKQEGPGVLARQTLLNMVADLIVR